MKFLVVLLFLAFCSNSALSRKIQPRNPLLTSTVRSLLEDNRANFANIHLDELSIGVARVTNVNIQNLETFTIEEISSPLLALKINNLTLSVAYVQLTGSYQFDNTELPLVGTLNGKGDFSIGLQGVRIFTALSFKTNSALKVVLDKIDNLTIDVNLANALFDGIDGGDDTNALISSVLPDQIRDAAVKLLAEGGQELVDAINGLASAQ